MARDYRQLNAVTVFDSEPCEKVENLYKFSGSIFFSELDVSKAYYQVPLTEGAKPMTAFPTHLGLMEFCRLPFGLVTACATYIRLMRIFLVGLSNVTFDNILIFSVDWSVHCFTLQAVFDRIQTHGLTLKSSKCHYGFPSLQYLGFIPGCDWLQPQPDKIEAILRVPPPQMKKDL